MPSQHNQLRQCQCHWPCQWHSPNQTTYTSEFHIKDITVCFVCVSAFQWTRFPGKLYAKRFTFRPAGFYFSGVLTSINFWWKNIDKHYLSLSILISIQQEMQVISGLISTLPLRKKHLVSFFPILFIRDGDSIIVVCAYGSWWCSFIVHTNKSNYEKGNTKNKCVGSTCLLLQWRPTLEV